jgi:hypothetical protein
MPIHSCALPDGSSGYKWGDEGKCYADRADAEKQAQAAYANGYSGDADIQSIAMDKSVRRIDQDGHLHVELSNISKANVCPYYGKEIPDADKYGLKPDQLYHLYRHPDALKKAADSFNGKPLLIVHKPQTADEHDHKLVIGSVHNVAFDKPYLTAELVVWDGDAIKLIEAGEQRELSCGYYYRFVPEPGVADGMPYDGYMTDIVGNHVALVTEGRAGRDVFVGDAKPTPGLPPAPSPEVPLQQKEPQIMATRHANLSRQALLASGALRAYLRPKLAADTKLDLDPILQPVTVKNWQDQKPKIKAALDSALAGKLAKDAEISDIIDILEELDDAVDKDDEEIAADESDDDDDDEEEKKKKAKEAAEKLKEAAAEDESDDDDDDDEEEKKKKAKEAAEKLKDAAEDESDDDDDDEDKRAKDRKGAKDRRSAKDRKGARDKAKGMDEQPMITKAAMDAAIASAVTQARKQAAQDAEASTIARLRAIAEAERAVRPHIGEITVAQDSAAAVYRLALDAAGVDLAGVPEAAFPAMVKMLQKPSEQTQPVATKVGRVALDSAAVSKRNEMFPNAHRLLVN